MGFYYINIMVFNMDKQRLVFWTFIVVYCLFQLDLS
jgi:hypothetical protein